MNGRARTALVTATSSGIGAATVRSLAAEAPDLDVVVSNRGAGAARDVRRG